MVFGIETDFWFDTQTCKLLLTIQTAYPKPRWQALTPTARLAEFNTIRKPFWFEYSITDKIICIDNYLYKIQHKYYDSSFR